MKTVNVYTIENIEKCMYIFYQCYLQVWILIQFGFILVVEIWFLDVRQTASLSRTDPVWRLFYTLSRCRKLLICQCIRSVPSTTSMLASGRPRAQTKSSAASRIDQVSAELIDIKSQLKIIADHLITSSGLGSNPANNNISRSKPGVQYSYSAALVGKSSHDNAVPGPSKQPTTNPGLPRIPGPGSNQPSIDPDLRAAMLSAVHSEFNSVSQRAMNVVVSGLPIRNDISDANQFSQICKSYFSFNPTIRTTHRFGRAMPGKTQLLLISLTSTADVEHILSFAQILRTSADPLIRDSVFVNKHRTRAESRAAFEERVNRRNRKQQRDGTGQISAPGSAIVVEEMSVEQNLIDLAPTEPSTSTSTSLPILPLITSGSVIGPPPSSSTSGTKAPSISLTSGANSPSTSFTSGANPPSTSFTSGVDPPSTSTVWRGSNTDIIPAYLFNARSLRNKLPDLHQFIYSSEQSLFFITESWLSADVTDQLLDPMERFSVVRCDRRDRVGGGVCAIIPKHFRYTVLNINLIESLKSGCDITGLDIYINKLRYRFILVYKPPIKFNISLEQSRASALCNTLNELYDASITNFILGDFNLPHVNWSTNVTKIDGIHNAFVDCLSQLGFTQFIHEPTRVNSGCMGNILDLVFCNDTIGTNIDQLLAPFSTSDHSMIKFSIFVPTTEPLPVPDKSTVDQQDSNHNITLPIYDWNSGDYAAINECLSNFDWNELFGFNFDCESIWDKFKSIICRSFHCMFLLN